jgi:FAD/FMN-containing dehydrogenase
MRPPAVLARAAASLDLLSDGRFELGLGAGGFWDAIEAMGGIRHTPGEGVAALEEALEVIHSIWEVSERAPLRFDGDYYRLDGAKRGPAPAHPIPIWLGARKPRMLRLIGRKADGWLPSLPYLEPGDLAAGNRTIDEAAEKAGRDPREIHRLLNIGAGDGSAQRWVDELIPFALEDGVSTFIVMGDDPAVLERFALEVIPMLRETVAGARAETGTSAGPIRSAVALAKRRDGIDYEALPESLKTTAIEPGDFGYSKVRSTYLRGGAPGLVLRVHNTTEVVEALAFARTQDVPLGVRSAGHGVSGRSTNDGGIVIDLSPMNTIEVLDEATRRVRIEPGARWVEVAKALSPHGWALTSGDYGGVGVGGLATAGGVGWFAREHGLTIDHLRAVDMVLADGSVVRASDAENPELFWAVRGAGANFGIVTSFEFEADELGSAVAFAQLVFDASDTAGVLERWAAAVEAAPRDLTSQLILGPARPGQPRYAQVMALVDSDDEDTIIDRLQPLADVAPLVDQSVALMSYSNVLAQFMQDGAQNGQGEPNARSGLVDHVTTEFAAASERVLDSGAVYFFQLRAVGGAVSDVDSDATAYAGRSANFSVAAFGARPAELDTEWATLRQYFSGMYLSFESSLDESRLEDAFPPRTLACLRELKRRYDPGQVFRDNFAIPPA